MTKLQTAIQHAINCASAENGSDTPDFILAEYLTDCLAAYNCALVAREKWYKGERGIDGLCKTPDNSTIEDGFGNIWSACNVHTAAMNSLYKHL